MQAVERSDAGRRVTNRWGPLPVAGAVALMLQRDPTLTPDRVKYMLTSTARATASVNPMDVGAGMMDVVAAMNAPAGTANQNVVRGTGFASLDQEVQGMVRRASPFPAPPNGRGMSFTVPVSFRIQ